MKDTFVEAIKAKRKLRLTFYSKQDGHNLTRTCAPMDYGPSRRTNHKKDRYHFWDYESDTKNHTLSLLPEQIVSIDILADKFEPSEFVTWETNWFVSRDWGNFS